MSTPAQIRRKIQDTKNELARFQGEAESQNQEIKEAKTKLAKLLGCRPGSEKAAVKKIRTRIEKNQNKVEKLLERAEEIRDDR